MKKLLFLLVLVFGTLTFTAQSQDNTEVLCGTEIQEFLYPDGDLLYNQTFSNNLLCVINDFDEGKLLISLPFSTGEYDGRCLIESVSFMYNGKTLKGNTDKLLKKIDKLISKGKVVQRVVYAKAISDRTKYWLSTFSNDTRVELLCYYKRVYSMYRFYPVDLDQFKNLNTKDPNIFKN